jgi:hypothetical protein
MRRASFALLPLMVALTTTSATAQISATIHIGPIRLGGPVVAYRDPAPIVVIGYPDAYGYWQQTAPYWRPVTLYVLGGRYYERPFRNARSIVVYNYRGSYFQAPRDRDWDRYRVRYQRDYWDRQNWRNDRNWDRGNDRWNDRRDDRYDRRDDRRDDRYDRRDDRRDDRYDRRDDRRDDRVDRRDDRRDDRNGRVVIRDDRGRQDARIAAPAGRPSTNARVARPTTTARAARPTVARPSVSPRPTTTARSARPSSNVRAARPSTSVRAAPAKSSRQAPQNSRARRKN